jgi:hypothetical protein
LLVVGSLFKIASTSSSCSLSAMRAVAGSIIVASGSAAHAGGRHLQWKERHVTGGTRIVVTAKKHTQKTENDERVMR